MRTERRSVQILQEIDVNTSTNRRIKSILGNPKSNRATKAMNNARNRKNKYQRKKSIRKVTFDSDKDVVNLSTTHKLKKENTFPLKIQSTSEIEFDRISLNESFSSIESICFSPMRKQEKNSTPEQVQQQRSNTPRIRNKLEIDQVLTNKKVKKWHQKLKESPSKILKRVQTKKQKNLLLKHQPGLLKRAHSFNLS